MLWGRCCSFRRKRRRAGSVTGEICKVSAILGEVCGEPENGEEKGKGNEGTPCRGPKNAAVVFFGPITRVECHFALCLLSKRSSGGPDGKVVVAICNCYRTHSKNGRWYRRGAGLVPTYSHFQPSDSAVNKFGNTCFLCLRGEFTFGQIAAIVL